LFKLRKRAKGSRKSRSSPIKTPRQLFHGVGIRLDETDPCDAVRNLENLRFLADDAPRLPLPDCTNPQGCRCTYEHFDDRRTSARRESDIGLPVKDHPNDLRSGLGRRVTDG
jgi:hypothetical protein